MRYAYYNLGEQPAATSVSLRLTGSAANVILLDSANFDRYRARQPFEYVGGHYLSSPVELEVPRDGRWILVVDLGGFKGRVTGRVQVHPPAEAGAADTEGALVEA